MTRDQLETVRDEAITWWRGASTAQRDSLQGRIARALVEMASRLLRHREMFVLVSEAVATVQAAATRDQVADPYQAVAQLAAAGTSAEQDAVELLGPRRAARVYWETLHG